MAEAQAVDRVYRIGQQREVVITRYIVPKSIETVREDSRTVYMSFMLTKISIFNGSNNRKFSW